MAKLKKVYHPEILVVSSPAYGENENYLEIEMCASGDKRFLQTRTCNGGMTLYEIHASGVLEEVKGTFKDWPPLTMLPATDLWGVTLSDGTHIENDVIVHVMKCECRQIYVVTEPKLEGFGKKTYVAYDDGQFDFHSAEDNFVCAIGEEMIEL